MLSASLNKTFLLVLRSVPVCLQGLPQRVSLSGHRGAGHLVPGAGPARQATARPPPEPDRCTQQEGARNGLAGTGRINNNNKTIHTDTHARAYTHIRTNTHTWLIIYFYVLFYIYVCVCVCVCIMCECKCVCIYKIVKIKIITIILIIIIIIRK